MEGSAVITSKPFQELDPVVEGSAVITSKYAMKSPMSSKRTEICRTLMNKPGSLLAQCSGSFILFSPWLFLRPLNQAQGRIVLIVVVIFDQLAPLASIKIAILQSLEGRKGRV